MALKDLFKSEEQKKLEAQQAAQKEAKAKTDKAELELFQGVRQLESKIKELEIEKKKRIKRYNALDESTKEAASVLAEFKAISKELEAHKAALQQINAIKGKALGGTVGAEPLNDTIFKILAAVNILSTPEVTGGMTEDEKTRIEMELTKKTEGISVTGGTDVLGRLASIAGQGIDDTDGEMSDEEAIAEIKGITASEDINIKIKNEIKGIDEKVKNLMSNTTD